MLENLGADFGRHVALVEHGAPGDIAGVVRLHSRQELLAHGGAHAVGADQQVAGLARAVGEDRGDAVGVLLDRAAATCRDDSFRPAEDRAARDRAGPTSSWSAPSAPRDRPCRWRSRQMTRVDLDPINSSKSMPTRRSTSISCGMGAETGAAAGRDPGLLRSNTTTSQPMLRRRCAASSPPSEPPITKARREGMLATTRSADFAHAIAQEMLSWPGL